MIPIIVIILFIYFIKEQFSFNTVTKFSYYFLPAFSLLQVILSFHITKENSIILTVSFTIGLLVGYFQSKHATIREHLLPVYIYFDEKGAKKNIYKNQVAIKGGMPYLLGWLIIFVTQLTIQFILTSTRIEFSSSLYEELLEDLFAIYRLQDFNTDSKSWYVWSLYGFSSLTYLLFLCKRNSLIKDVLFHTNKEIITPNQST